MSQEFKIINPDGDFYQVQNYVIQLVAEKKITTHAHLLYSFYKSLSGFEKIVPGYKWIHLNTGISKGNITKCNQLLIEYGLITLKTRGKNKAFEIFLTPGNKIPRRQLKKNKPIVHEVNTTVHVVNSEDEKCSSDEPIKTINKYTINKNNTTGDDNFTVNEKEFITKYKKYWESKFKSKYTKNDANIIKKIDKIKEAIKYIPVLWSLGSEDRWISKSDYSLTVFCKEYMNGRIQAFFPKTVYSYKEKAYI